MNTKGLLLSLTLVLWARAKLGSAEANAACKTPCSCVTRIGKIVNYHAARLKTAKQNYDTNIRDLLRLFLATLQADAAEKPKLLPVLASAGGALEACRTALAQEEADQPMISAAMSALAKTYTIYNSLIKKTSTLTLTADGSGHFKNTGIAGSVTHENATASCQEEGKEEENTKITDTNVQQEPDLPELAITGVTTLTCKKESSSPATCSSNTITNGGEIKAVIKHQTAAATQSTASWSSNTMTPGAILVTEVKLTGDNKTNVDAAMKKIKGSKVHLKCGTLLTSYSTVATNDEFKRLVLKALLGKQDNEKTSAESVAEYNKAIKEAYGEGGTDYEAKVWTKVKATQAEINKGDDAGNEPLETIDTLDKLTAAIARKINKDLTEAARPKAENKIESEREKGCTEETDKAKCNKKTGCKYNEKDSKCQEDPAQATATAPPTTNTNTTGNNSFVINKTPLLLAVFVSRIRLLRFIGKSFLPHFIKFIKYGILNGFDRLI